MAGSDRSEVAGSAGPRNSWGHALPPRGPAIATVVTGAMAGYPANVSLRLMRLCRQTRGHGAVSAGSAPRADFLIAQRPLRRLCAAVARGGS
jgi:hypothetical protein